MLTAPDKKRYEGIERRVLHMGLVLLAAFSLLGVRLWYLQMVNWRDAQGRDAADLVAKYRLRREILKAPRGMIYGRDPSIVLADNQASCDLMLVPADCQNPEEVSERLASLVSISADDLLAKIELAKKQRKAYTQILVKRDISKTEIARVEESLYDLPEVFTMFRPQRRYWYGKTAGQLLGYLSEIGPEELERKSEQYDMGDLIGRDGLEAKYEDDLRGKSGQILVVRYASGDPQLRTDELGSPFIYKDTKGRRLVEAEGTGRKPEAGGAIHTTLDIGLQTKAEKLLEGQIGAICVLNADTGEVLALASHPGYDPSAFINRSRARERMDILQDTTLHPMLNRCFQAAYPPGSVFKVLLASAALEEGAITESTTFNCPGHYTLPTGGRSWSCWQHSGHGGVSVVGALTISCDVFFYNVGLKLGVDKINKYGELMGLGRRTGLDLPKEDKGLVPSPEWKKELVARTDPNPYEQKWYPGDTLNLAIGQGSMSATPLQCTVLMASIINGGRRVRPYINQELGPEVSEPFLSEKTLEIVRRGMRACVEKDDYPSGTGRMAKIPGLVVLGKTGSAQMVGNEQLKKAFSSNRCESPSPYWSSTACTAAPAPPRSRKKFLRTIMEIQRPRP
ncbi:MAG: penicillin-binding protein 2 [Candidatus Hydrogenedentes bacterium]|nr:penicillin-binding protein 2 [Candidatus Hydrogenedentota bacterium]